MQIYTMGFTQKNAETFFGLILENGIALLVDVRLNNQSQLAGFTKEKDLTYFLKKIGNCEYDHNIACAPTKELRQSYRKKEITWEAYEKQYLDLIVGRDVAGIFKRKYAGYAKILLLCSEPEAKFCHRRYLAEYLQKELGCGVTHI